MDILKNKILLNSFEYLETGDLSFALSAKEQLSELAKIYHISIKKSQRTDLKNAFKVFILNERGFIETIQLLYNAL